MRGYIPFAHWTMKTGKIDPCWIRLVVALLLFDPNWPMMAPSAAPGFGSATTVSFGRQTIVQPSIVFNHNGFTSHTAGMLYRQTSNGHVDPTTLDSLQIIHFGPVPKRLLREASTAVFDVNAEKVISWRRPRGSLETDLNLEQWFVALGNGVPQVISANTAARGLFLAFVSGHAQKTGTPVVSLFRCHNAATFHDQGDAWAQALQTQQVVIDHFDIRSVEGNYETFPFATVRDLRKILASFHVAPLSATQVTEVSFDPVNGHISEYGRRSLHVVRLPGRLFSAADEPQSLIAVPHVNSVERHQRSPLLQIHMLAFGAVRLTGRWSRTEPGRWSAQSEAFHSWLEDCWGGLYMLALPPIGEIVRRMGRGEYGLDEYPYYIQNDERGRRRLVVYQPFRGNHRSIGSAFATEDPRGVNPAWGTSGDLDVATYRLWAAGKENVVDVAPNHLGVDSPWLNNHWQATVHVNLFDVLPPEVLEKLDDRVFFNPQQLRDLGLDHLLTRRGLSTDPEQCHYFVFYTEPGNPRTRILIAHGRDPYFKGWVDTAQLDYTQAEARDYVRGTFEYFAKRHINVRADMSGLVTRLAFWKLWYPAMPWEEFSDRWPSEFWKDIVDRVMDKYEDFTIAMEAYGETGRYLKSLHPRISVYEKQFRDDILRRDVHAVRRYLRDTPLEDLYRSVYFIQNHDDAAPWTMPESFLKTAMVLLATIPGRWMVHYRQLEGKGPLPVQELLPDEDEKNDPENPWPAFHRQLLSLAASPIVQKGR